MKTIQRISALVVAVWMLMAASAAQATSYRFETIAFPNSSYTFIGDVNDAGQIVGLSQSGLHPQGFLFENGTFTPITGPAGAISTTAMGITDDGSVVGSFYTGLRIDPVSGDVFPGYRMGFIFDGSSYATFTLPETLDIEVRGVSPDGRYVTGRAIALDGRGRGFLYNRQDGDTTWIGDPAGFSDIVQGINDDYRLVGSERFVVDDDGRMVVTSYTYDAKAALYADHVVTDDPGTHYRAIDEAGRIAGWMWPDTGQVGFVLTSEGLEIVRVPGANGTVIQGMNNAGVLVGSFDTVQGQFGFVATPVPEPETWALMLAGLAVIGATGKRRSNR